MSSIDISIPHQLPEEEALGRIKTLLRNTVQQQGDKITNLQEHWDGKTGTFSFTAMGYDIAGTLTVLPDKIDLHAKVPFAVSLFKGTISKMIRDRADELLS